MGLNAHSPLEATTEEKPEIQIRNIIFSGSLGGFVLFFYMEQQEKTHTVYLTALVT